MKTDCERQTADFYTSSKIFSPAGLAGSYPAVYNQKLTGWLAHAKQHNEWTMRRPACRGCMDSIRMALELPAETP